ncbi:22461_t:CDS:2, partial [Gigaspora margarita]
DFVVYYKNNFSSMFKQDIKTITQDAGTFYDTIFNHPKDNVNKEIKSFVREFESNRNNREYGNLEKCIVLAQGAADKFSSGTFLFDKKLNDIKEKSNFYVIIGRTGDVKTEREQKLIKEYRTMIEEALRGVYDPSASVTSNITSGSSSKNNN